VKEQMTQLFNQIGQPLMQDIQLTWPNEKVEFFPKEIPDLYAGQPLMISARWPNIKTKNTNKNISVLGKLASTNWQENFDISEEENNDVSAVTEVIDNGVAQWWAKQKITHLISLQRRASDLKKGEYKSQITLLALRHHLVSPYTSFIAIEDKMSRNSKQRLPSRNIKNLMPKGSTQVIPLANTSIGLLSYFYASLLFVFMWLLARYLMTKLNQTGIATSC
jgi:Ca-activated chloride channel family protein